MIRFARFILVLLTIVAAVAAGVLNGRVLCMAGSNDVAIEEPHGAGRHASHHHADQQGDEEDQMPDRGCTDLQTGGTLVSEARLTAHDNAHWQIALPLAPPILLPSLSAFTPGRTSLLFAGPAPASADLACLRSIILVV